MSDISAGKALEQLEIIKKRYDLLKWISGIGLGLLTGAFFAGAYYAQVKNYFAEKTIPPKMVAYFELQDCPKGWSRADFLRGRYAVGRDPAGKANLGRTVGIALDDAEDRATGAHTHPYVDTQTVYNTSAKGIAQGKTEPWGVISSTRETNPPSGTKPGTNAPYVLLSACSKD